MASPRTRKVLKEVRAQDENNVSVNLWAGLGWAGECLAVRCSCGPVSLLGEVDHVTGEQPAVVGAHWCGCRAWDTPVTLLRLC